MPVRSVKSARLSPFASRGLELLEHLVKLVEGGQTLVVAGDQVGQFLSDLITNRLVLGGFFGRQPPVAGDAFHGCCLLGTS